MKKFRLISAVSVIVLSMSVPAMAMPVYTDIASNSSQCARTKVLNQSTIAICDSNGNIIQNGFNSQDIDSILKNLNCSIQDGSVVTPNFNCDLNGGSVANNNAWNNGSCSDDTCTDNSCTNDSCTDNSCTDDSCPDDSCSNDYSDIESNVDNSSNIESNVDNSSNIESNVNNSKNVESNVNDSKNIESNVNDSNNMDLSNNGSTNNSSSNNVADNVAPNSDKTVDTSTSISAYAQQVVDLVNQERAKLGISPLAVDMKVTAAAQVRAKEIKTSFSHTRPDGRSCFTALDEAGASYMGAGENIAIGQRTPEQVVNDWMNSEGHRKNILNSNFKYIGVGVDGTAWTQLFTY